MKTTFTKNYILENRGCYTLRDVNSLSFINKTITINDILSSEKSLKDKGWWVLRKCELTTKQKKAIVLSLAEIVLPIYEKKYPKDTRVGDCINSIKDFDKGKIAIIELHTAAVAIHDAAYDPSCDAASDAAYAAYAAACASFTNSVEASDYAENSINSVVNAAGDEYKTKILKALKDVFKIN